MCRCADGFRFCRLDFTSHERRKDHLHDAAIAPLALGPLGCCLGTMTSLKRDAADGVGSALLKKLSLSDDTLKSRLELIRSLVAKPIDRGPDFLDPQPALVEGGCVLIGSKNHAADIPNLKRLGGIYQRPPGLLFVSHSAR